MAMEEDAYNMLSDIIDKNNMSISSFIVNVQTPKWKFIDCGKMEIISEKKFTITLSQGSYGTSKMTVIFSHHFHSS